MRKKCLLFKNVNPIILLYYPQMNDALYFVHHYREKMSDKILKLQIICIFIYTSIYIHRI